MTYKTQPGTIPHRVLTYLKSQPEGAEFTSVQICEAIGCDADNFAYLMRRAIKGGALKMRMKPGFAKLLFWSLGDGKPLPEPEDHEDDAPLPRKPAPAPRPGPLFPSVFPPKESQEFRAALWTDGSLILCGVDVRPDGSVVLPAAQTAQVKNLIAWSAPA